VGTTLAMKRHRDDPERATEAETEAQAAAEPDDPTTAREELELDLMEADASDAGEVIGDEMP
jgi:hypothetical protein